MKNLISLNKRLLKLISLLTIVLLYLGCGNKNKENEPITELNYGIVLSPNQERNLDNFNKIVQFISDRIGVKINVFKGADYATIIEAMKTGKVDMASTGAFSYLIAAARAEAEPLVTSAYPDNSIYYYNTCIYTSSTSGIESIQDVKDKASMLSITFPDPASTSGYLYPKAYLNSIGLDPNEAFKDVVFSGTSAGGVHSCLAGRVDLGAMSTIGLLHLVSRGDIKEEDYRILWQSKSIPPPPVYVRKQLSKEIKEGITDAYIAMYDDPEMREFIKNQYSKEIRFIPVTDSLYRDLKKIVIKEYGDIFLK